MEAVNKKLDTTKSKIDGFQQSLLDSVAPIKAMANQLNYLLLGMKGVQKATVTASQTLKKATKTTYNYTEAQKALDIQTTDGGKSFTKAGFKVDEYGRALNNAGERVNNFNKRTALMQATVKKMNKDGEKNVGFLKGWSEYTKLGGNSAEYFAEFLTSSREELTIFGLEAGKARKVLYGFAPPGTFRVLNKFSSILQFVGGTYRKMGDDGRFAKDKIIELQDALKKAEMQGNADEVKAYKEQIAELQETVNPNIFSKLFGTLTKMAKIPNIWGGKGKTGLDLMKPFRGPEGGRRSIISSFGAPKDKREELGSAREKQKSAEKKRAELISQRDKDMAGPMAGNEQYLIMMNDQIQKQSDLMEEGAEEEENILKDLMSKHPYFVRMYKLGKMFLKVPKMIKILIQLFFKAYYYFAFLVLGLLVIVKTIGPMFSNIWSAVSAMFAVGLELMSGSIAMIWEGLTDIWNAFFGDGDLDTAINGLVKVGLGALGFIGSLIVTLAGSALVFIGATAAAIGRRLYDFFTGSAKIGRKIVIALAIVSFFVATFWFQMSLFPALLVGLLIYWIGKKIGQWLGFWATGGVVDKPLQMVGERGPELVSMARGTRVYSNSETKKMMGSKAGGNTINITINARDTSDKELRRIATKIGDMVNRQVNRGTSSRTV